MLENWKKKQFNWSTREKAELTQIFQKQLNPNYYYLLDSTDNLNKNNDLVSYTKNY